MLQLLLIINVDVSLKPHSGALQPVVHGHVSKRATRTGINLSKTPPECALKVQGYNSLKSMISEDCKESNQQQPNTGFTMHTHKQPATYLAASLIANFYQK